MASIKRRPDGKWRARYRDAQKKEHARHFKLKRDAEAWLEDVGHSVRAGSYVDPRGGKVPFSDFYREWADRQLWAVSTRETADRAVDATPFLRTPLAQIERRHIEAWIKAMTAGERPLAPTTIRTRLNYVSMVFRGAVRDKRIPDDPTAGVKLPRRRRADQAMTVPTVTQVRAALDAAPAEYRALVAVCAFAGLRLGEAAGLRAGDVNLDDRLLRVERQVQGETVATTRLEAPKAGSERTIAIPAELCNIIRDHCEDIGTIRAENYLFFRGGELLNRNSAGHIWREIRKTAGLPEEHTLHTLRHFYASALISSGCDVVTVQRALGHAQPSITLNIYAHLWPSAEDRTRAAAGELMRSVLEADPR